MKRISASGLLELQAQRICVIKPSALGDVVQTLPLLPALRARYPDSRITWVVNRELSEVLTDHPHLDEVLPFDRRASLRSWFRLLGELRQRQFDLVLDLQGLLRTGVMTAATGAPVRIGLETSREGANLSCNGIVANTHRHIPAHQRYWRVAEVLGAGHVRPLTQIAVRREHSNWAETVLAGLKRPILAIHPGARWVTKRWPVEKFAVVACRALRSLGFSAVILGGESDAVLGGRLDELVRRFHPAGRVLNLAGQTNLKQLAVVLKASAVLLTNDSGPMHLAAGLGTPVLGVFTCTDPARSGPPGDRHVLVQTNLSCAASYKRRCPHRGRKHLHCMDELSTDRVYRGLQLLIQKNRVAPKESRAA